MADSWENLVPPPSNLQQTSMETRGENELNQPSFGIPGEIGGLSELTTTLGVPSNIRDNGILSDGVRFSSHGLFASGQPLSSVPPLSRTVQNNGGLHMAREMGDFRDDSQARANTASAEEISSDSLRRGRNTLPKLRVHDKMTPSETMKE
eukprot:4535149-Amphidinium_carterae.1